MDKKIIISAVVILVLAAAYLTFSGPKTEPQQLVRVSGAWALYPMMVKWADEYQKVNPGIRVDVSAGGAGKGMADALSGLVEIGMVSRDIDPTEVERGAYGIRVVKDAVVPTFNKNNPIAAELLKNGLRRDEFKNIFVSGKATKWGDLIGRASVPNKISVYVRSDSCGAAEVWAKYLGGKQEDLVGIGVNGDPGIAEAVSRDINGIGFNNLNFAYDAKTGDPVGDINILPIDLNGNGKIDPKENFYSKKADMIVAIDQGRYPSPPARDLYLVTKNRPQGPAGEFVRWILTDGQKYVAGEGYISISQAVLSEEITQLQ